MIQSSYELNKVFFLNYVFIHLFIWLSWIFISMWDLVSWPGIEPGTPALGTQNLNLWTSREIPNKTFK